MCVRASELAGGFFELDSLPILIILSRLSVSLMNQRAYCSFEWSFWGRRRQFRGPHEQRQ